MVPEGWVKRDLQGLVTIKHGFAFKSEFFASEGELVLLTPGSFYESGGFRDQGEKTKYYVGDIPKGYLLEKGDMLIAMTEQAEGLLGSALFVPASNKYLHNQRLGLVQITQPDRVCLDYLYLFFNFPTSRRQIAEQSTGTKVKHTSPDRLCSVVGLVPPLPEQKKIAKILSTWDKAITTTEQLLAKSQQQKKALMQQLLTGKRRLLDKNGASFEREWRKLPFSDLVSLVKTKFDPKTNADDVRECIELEHITQVSSSLCGSTNTTDAVSAKTAFKKGDVLFGKLRPYLRKHWKADRQGVCSTEIWVFRAKDKVAADYICHVVQLDSFIEVANKSSGTHMPRADWNVLKDFLIPTPPLEEQQKIAAVLFIADHEISALQQKLNALKKEKKALMQQLLTGKRRLRC